VENAASLRLDLQVPERLAGLVHPGMAISVRQDEQQAQGRVLSVSGSLDPLTRSLAAKASLAAGSSLVPGKAVMATLAGTGKATGVAVPASAVAHIAGHDVVFVREAKGFRAVKVTVAGQVDNVAYLSGGLKPAAQIATSGVAELKSLSAGL
jgi:cobalt-zinc-cadmium efflux system membrane fusion protein